MIRWTFAFWLADAETRTSRASLSAATRSPARRLSRARSRRTLAATPATERRAGADESFGAGGRAAEVVRGATGGGSWCATDDDSANRPGGCGGTVGDETGGAD